MPPRRPAPDFLNGVPELLLLRLLAAREMYGYELAKAVRTASAEALALGEGVLYPALHALEGDGCVTSRTETVAGRPRVYYRLTPRGEERLAERTGAWRRAVTAVSRVLRRPLRARPAR